MYILVTFGVWQWAWTPWYLQYMPHGMPHGRPMFCWRHKHRFAAYLAHVQLCLPIGLVSHCLKYLYRLAFIAACFVPPLLVASPPVRTCKASKTLHRSDPSFFPKMCSGMYLVLLPTPAYPMLLESMRMKHVKVVDSKVYG